MGGTLTIIVFVILILIGIFVLPQILFRRAVRNVIAIFRARDAVSEEKARTVQELGLAERTFLQRMGRRDYKPTALRALTNAKVIGTTSDNRLYLDESRLSGPLAKRQES